MTRAGLMKLRPVPGAGDYCTKLLPLAGLPSALLFVLVNPPPLPIPILPAFLVQ